MRYFNTITTLAELKATYRKLAFEFHPDRGGDIEIMKAINNEYDEVFADLKAGYNSTVKEERQTTEMPEDYRVIIEAIINLEGLEIEICGNWIWLTGNTKEHKDILKGLGFKWAPKKKSWYWRADEYKSYGRKNTSMNDIRNKYGSNGVKTTTKIN